jgi:hypothetical protein
MEVRILKNKTLIRASIIFSKCPTLWKGKHLCNKVPSNYTKKIHRMFYVTENSQGVVEALKQFLTIKMALLEAPIIRGNQTSFIPITCTNKVMQMNFHP